MVCKQKHEQVLSRDKLNILICILVWRFVGCNWQISKRGYPTFHRSGHCFKWREPCEECLRVIMPP